METDVKKYLLIVSVFIMIFESVSLFAEYNITARVVGDVINIRENPDKRSKIIGELRQNQKTRWIKSSGKHEYINKKFGQWVYVKQIDNEKNTGWVFDAYLNYDLCSSSSNKYISRERVKEKNIYEIIIYEKYIIFGLLDGNNISGFSVYKYKSNLYADYGNEKPIYITQKNNPEFVIGIIGDCLLIDVGTAPGTRGLTIYDLKSKSVKYDGVHNYIGSGGVHFVENISENQIYVYRSIEIKEQFDSFQPKIVSIDYSNLINMLNSAKSLTEALKQDQGYISFRYSILYKLIFNVENYKVKETNILEIVQEQ